MVAAWLASLSEAEVVAWTYDWEATYARPEQRLPPGDWPAWLIQAGRGFGKTRVGAETIRRWARDFRLVNLIGPTTDDIRDVMVEGESGVLACCPPRERPIYRVSKRRLEWPNGSRSLLFSADEPERLRGKQHMKLWCFIAGTRIWTRRGAVAIENVRVGEHVATRAGWREVVAGGSRIETVGTVRFSNGASLTGTGDHPVLTSCGWATLQALFIGQNVQTATWAPTSERAESPARERTSTSIAGRGNAPTEQYRQVARFTTATEILPTTRSRTFSASLIASIAASMARTWSVARGHAKRLLIPTSARSAAPPCSSPSFGENPTSDQCFAPGAEPLPQSRRAKRRERAQTAANLFFLGSGTSVASVASTWEPAGLQRVYNLTVARNHEYVANGVIVHNCDEAASWRYPEAWDQAMLGLRLGACPQAVVTTTPKPVKLIKELLVQPGVVVTRGTTYDNRDNLAAAFYRFIITKYEGTRLGRQELNAELLLDNPGALWTRDVIESLRISPEAFSRVDIQRTVVAMDPSVSSNEDSDEMGIVGAAVDSQWPPHFYIVADASDILSPDKWVTRAVALYGRLKADRIIGETNNGGDMIEALLRTKDMNIAYRGVHASKNKVTRAEPVAALYEQGRVHHVGSFATLEDQMCDYDPAVSTTSPDRMDALVWAMTELAERSGAFALGDYMKKEEVEMEEKIKQRLEKPATSADTPRCPDAACASLSISRAGGAWRCNACGAQFGGAIVPAVGQSRRDLVK